MPLEMSPEIYIKRVFLGGQRALLARNKEKLMTIHIPFEKNVPRLDIFIRLI